MNVVILSGNLGKDATINTETGKTYLHLAVSSYKKEGDKLEPFTQWIDVIKKSSNVDEYLKKGTKIEVIGFLIGNSSEKEKNTEDKYINTLGVYAHKVEIKSAKPKDDNNQENSNVSK